MMFNFYRKMKPWKTNHAQIKKQAALRLPYKRVVELRLVEPELSTEHLSAYYNRLYRLRPELYTLCTAGRNQILSFP